MFQFFVYFPARPHTKKQVLLLTDGMYNCAPSPIVERQANILKQKAEVFGMMIGINDQGGRDKLTRLVSKPIQDHLYSASDYNDFEDLVNTLQAILINTGMKCTPFI